MPNVMLTQGGLNFVKYAKDEGIFIYLKYFVPVYDDRIDPYIRTESSTLSSVQQVAEDGIHRLVPYGEVIWRKNGYSIDNTESYITSAGLWSPNTLYNSYQKSTVPVNLLNNQPLSDQISASEWTSINVGGGLFNWSATNAQVVSGVTPLEDSPSTYSEYWSAGDYYPVYEGPSLTQLRGSIKCIIDNSKGSFKFNKIALFASEAPPSLGTSVFFGEAYLSAFPAQISRTETGYSQFEFDIQLDISGVDATWEEIFFSSSADYWSHSPGGLYFPNRIGVGQFDGNTSEISAAMHLRYARQDLDTGIPILRMDYDNNRFDSIDISPNQYDVTESTDGKIGADIILNVANWNTYCGDAISIRPKITQSIALGTDEYRFRELYLENGSHTGSKDTTNIIPLNVISWYNHAISVNYGSITIGGVRGTSVPPEKDPFGITLQLRGIDIIDFSEIQSSYLIGAFKGGDLWREKQNLLIYNTYYKNLGKEYNVENIYIFAGLDTSASYASLAGQTGATHKNIVYEIERKSPGLFNSQNTNLSTSAELILGSKGKIGLFGPVELRNIGTTYNTALLISKVEDSGYAGDFNLVVGAGFKKVIAFTDIIEKANSIETMQDLLDNNSKLFLISKKIYVDSTIQPISNEICDLGTQNIRWNNLFSKRILAENISATDNIVSDSEIIAMENIRSYHNIYATMATFSNSGFYERKRSVAVGEWDGSLNNTTQTFLIADLQNYIQDKTNSNGTLSELFLGNIDAQVGTTTSNLTFSFILYLTHGSSITSLNKSNISVSINSNTTIENLLSNIKSEVNNILQNPTSNGTGEEFPSNFEVSLENGYVKVRGYIEGSFKVDIITFQINFPNSNIRGTGGPLRELTLNPSLQIGNTNIAPFKYTKVGKTAIVHGMVLTNEVVHSITVNLPEQLYFNQDNPLFNFNCYSIIQFNSINTRKSLSNIDIMIFENDNSLFTFIAQGSDNLPTNFYYTIIYECEQ